MQLTGNPSATVQVGYTTIDGIAVAPGDYTATSGIFTFNTAGSQTFTVLIINDTIGEPDEYIQLALTQINAPADVYVNPTISRLIIRDDEPHVQFSAATYTVNENAGTATIIVALNMPAAATVTVDYATSDGTALAGNDYTATSGTLTFSPGETVKTFTVPIINNPTQGVDKRLTLRLSNVNGGNAALGAPATATVTIVDDD